LDFSHISSEIPGSFDFLQGSPDGIRSELFFEYVEGRIFTLTNSPTGTIHGYLRIRFFSHFKAIAYGEILSAYGYY
jgi:hypothetical protein